MSEKTVESFFSLTEEQYNNLLKGRKLIDIKKDVLDALSKANTLDDLVTTSIGAFRIFNTIRDKKS